MLKCLLLLLCLISVGRSDDSAEAGYWASFVNEATPPFSQSLNGLSSLLDLILEYDDKDALDDNRYTNEPILSAIADIDSTLSATNSISGNHLSIYQSNIEHLSNKHSDYTAQAKAYGTQIEGYKVELERLDAVAKSIQAEINSLNELYQKSSEEIDKAERELERRRQCRVHLIILTVFVPVAGIGIITNEDQLNDAKNKRNEWQRTRDEHQRSLDNIHSQYRDVANRKASTEQTLASTMVSLQSTERTVSELKDQMIKLVAFGEKMQLMNTFLATFSARVSAVHNQNKIIFMFEPMLDVIDDLLEYLADNMPNISTLATKQAMNRFMLHLIKDPQLASGFWKNFVAHADSCLAPAMDKLSALLGLMVVEHDGEHFDGDLYGNETMRPAIESCRTALSECKAAGEKHSSSYANTILKIGHIHSDYDNQVNLYAHYESEIVRLTSDIDSMTRETQRFEELQKGLDTLRRYASAVGNARRNRKVGNSVPYPSPVYIPGCGTVQSYDDVDNCRNQLFGFRNSRNAYQVSLAEAREQLSNVTESKMLMVVPSDADLKRTSHYVEQLGSYRATLGNFGDKISNITSFLDVFPEGLLNLPQSERTVFLFSPITSWSGDSMDFLNVIQDLLDWLSDPEMPSVALLAVEEAMQKIRSYTKPTSSSK